MKEKLSFGAYIEFAEHLYTTRKIRHVYAPETVNNFHDNLYEDIDENFDEYEKAWEHWVNIK